MDPEIAELIGIDEEPEERPAFTSLFTDKTQAAPPASENETTISETFTKITEFEQKPRPHFRDKNYYKIALTGEGENTQKTHKLLTDFLGTQDPKDKSILRGKLVAAFWNLTEGIAAKIRGALPMPKILTLRFGCLLPTLISEEQRDVLSRIIFDNTTGEPFYYLDEWLKLVAGGQVSTSASDETRPSLRSEGQKVVSHLEKAKGLRDVSYGLVKNKLVEIETAETALREKVNAIAAHDRRAEFDGMAAEYNPAQKSALAEVLNLVRSLSALDRDLARFYRDLETATRELHDLQEKSAGVADARMVDDQAAVKEFTVVRQMTKMCVGRQGNHFPILMKQYFRPVLAEIGTRENVITQMAAVEAIDPGLFMRTFKGQTNRIVPYVVLLPCYGDQGICWEPFERFNKATSRGRVAIPLFPKDLKTAIITALADLRWQVEKERAQHYWMEEGLTGNYYQWFSESKLKGDVKEFFIQDYLVWITKESEGMQKLDRDVRSIFWRYIPFPDDLKEKLKNRGFVYTELIKKDKNRAMSDGY